MYQPAPRVHQTLINITKKFLHEPNPNPQSESFSARPPAARATRHAHDTPLEPTAAGYSSCDFSGARLGPHASLRRSAKFFGACGGQLDQILTNRRPAARTSTRSAGSLPNHIRDLYCDARERKPQQIFGACGGLLFSALTIWRLWRVARSYGLHITRIDRDECLRHRTQTRKYVAFLRSATANPKFSAPAASWARLSSHRQA